MKEKSASFYWGNRRKYPGTTTEKITVFDTKCMEVNNKPEIA
jgi:hypothetical protein